MRKLVLFFLAVTNCSTESKFSNKVPPVPTCQMTLSAADPMPQNISTIYLDDYLKGNPLDAYSQNHLLIPYTRVPIIVYTDFYKDLYPNDQEREIVRHKVIKFPGKRVLLIHDTHDYTFLQGFYSLYDFIDTWKIDYVISNYCGNDEFEVIKAGLRSLKVPIATIPNLVDGEVFKNRHLDKIYDVLIYGSTDGVYALRKRMFDILSKNRLGWKVKILSDRDVQGDALSILINQAHLAVATGSLFEYLVAKYFEIGHSHACILGNIPRQGQYLFKNNYIPLNLTMSYKEIENTISRALKNKAQLAHFAQKVAHDLKLYVSAERDRFMKKTLRLLAVMKLDIEEKR